MLGENPQSQPSTRSDIYKNKVEVKTVEIGYIYKGFNVGRIAMASAKLTLLNISIRDRIDTQISFLLGQ